jgi:hypothetical protein
MKTVTIALLLSGLLVIIPTTSRAQQSFYFTLNCSTGCTGSATAVLQLSASYTLGTQFTPSDLISLTYSSSDSGGAIVMTNFSEQSTGTISPGPPLSIGPGYFLAATSGPNTWVSGFGGFRGSGSWGMEETSPQQVILVNDQGGSYTLSNTPPSTAAVPIPLWALGALGAGLLVIAAGRERYGGRVEA